MIQSISLFKLRTNLLTERSNTLNYCLIIVMVSLVLRLIWISFNGLLVQEAYYWNYAEHLDWSYFDHPPLVAVLIKLSTLLFGLHEWSVHLPAIVGWGVTAYFSYTLTEHISRGAGWYAVMLLSVLPYFFMQSVVITPDIPVMVFWSAALYYFYRALILNEKGAWFAIGVCLGLGMDSKYTIVLLAIPTLSYIALVPKSRFWFARKEPYLAILIAFLLFSPVIYWNATHEWASFAFQSVQRFRSRSSFGLPIYIGFFLFFVTPLGVINLRGLFKKEEPGLPLGKDVRRFLRFYTLLPLSFFGIYSLTHLVKFDWIGPGLLPIFPYLATLLSASSRGNAKLAQQWFATAIILLLLYTTIIVVTTTGISGWVHKKFLAQYFSWSDLTQQFYSVANHVKQDTNQTPIFVPLDAYHIASELTFYQALLKQKGEIRLPYSVVGAHVFNRNSLMYQYWSNGADLSGKMLILISDHATDFDFVSLKESVIERSPLQIVWSHGQRSDKKLTPYYYQIVEMKSST